MIDVSIHIEIPNLDRRYMEVPCPVCRIQTWVTFGEIRRRGYAICRGCHANIRLEDHLGSLHRALRRIKSALKSLEG
jgi:hypothetical protein